MGVVELDEVADAGPGGALGEGVCQRLEELALLDPAGARQHRGERARGDGLVGCDLLALLLVVVAVKVVDGGLRFCDRVVALALRGVLARGDLLLLFFAPLPAACLAHYDATRQ